MSRRRRAWLQIAGAALAFAAAWVALANWAYEHMITPLADWLWPR